MTDLVLAVQRYQSEIPTIVGYTLGQGIATMGGASVIPVHEIRDLIYADQQEWADWAPRAERFADFAPMPQEFGDFAQMLEEAKVKSGTLICFECGNYNAIRQIRCEECGASVPQTALARWVYGYGKDK